MNRYFGGFGSFLSVREEEAGWLERRQSKGVLYSQGRHLKVYNTIIAEYAELHKLIEIHTSSQKAGFILLGKTVDGSGPKGAGMREMAMDAFFFLDKNQLEALFFVQVNRFYREHIRKDSYEMVNKFFNGLTKHGNFDFSCYLMFYKLFVLRTAS